jgi:hypothetical protein
VLRPGVTERINIRQIIRIVNFHYPSSEDEHSVHMLRFFMGFCLRPRSPPIVILFRLTVEF